MNLRENSWDDGCIGYRLLPVRVGRGHGELPDQGVKHVLHARALTFHLAGIGVRLCVASSMVN